MQDNLLISTLEMLFYLLIVLGLIAGLFFIIKKFRWGSTGSGYIRVLERVPLDSKNFLVLVRVKDSFLLLSTGEKGTSILKEYPAEEFAGQKTPLDHSLEVDDLEG